MTAIRAGHRSRPTAKRRKHRFVQRFLRQHLPQDETHELRAVHFEDNLNGHLEPEWFCFASRHRRTGRFVVSRVELRRWVSEDKVDLHRMAAPDDWLAGPALDENLPQLSPEDAMNWKLHRTAFATTLRYRNGRFVYDCSDGSCRDGDSGEELARWKKHLKFDRDRPEVYPAILFGIFAMAGVALVVTPKSYWQK